MSPDQAPLPTSFVAPAERERIIARLGESFAHDLLPLDEYERRVTLAYRAESSAALATLVADIAPLAAGRELESARPSSLVGGRRRFSAFFSNVEHRGPLDVPPRLEIRSVFGNVEVDLTSARFAPGVTEIDVAAVFGNVELWLPPHVAVENIGDAFLGTFTLRGAGHPPAAATTVVRLVGSAVLGNIEVSVVGGS